MRYEDEGSEQVICQPASPLIPLIMNGIHVYYLYLDSEIRAAPELDLPEQLLLINDLILESDNQTDPPYECQHLDLTFLPI